MILIGYKVPTNPIGWLKRENLWDYASPKEKDVFENANRTQKDFDDATWRSEALWTLLWSLGKIDELDLPRQFYDSERLQQVLPKPGDSCARFINGASLRSKSELLDATDLIYRIHWAVEDARLKKTPIPAGFNPDIVYERHYALNWLTFYSNDWDNVTTDT